jgi:hypothetical protein
MITFIIFRIIGWFIISVVVFLTIVTILSIEQSVEHKPMTGKFALVVLFINILTIWFIYTAMQI